jgi:hypothetical protein
MKIFTYLKKEKEMNDEQLCDVVQKVEKWV